MRRETEGKEREGKGKVGQDMSMGGEGMVNLR